MKHQSDTPIRAVGVIAEYNPFHNGHAYQLKKARELSGANYCIAAISGDFVQRGGPAVFDKYTRTAMALESGADLVVELPPIFASSSAEDFASCGVALSYVNISGRTRRGIIGRAGCGQSPLLWQRIRKSGGAFICG
mgnify:CR=1 FL=1